MTAVPNTTLVEVGEMPSIDTTKLFKPVIRTASPIDNFIAHTNAINRILANSSGDPTPELCSVIVLGYLSAVETYFRTLLSRLAHVDPLTQKLLSGKLVMFSVAMSRPKGTLAEALYEDSFAQAKDIKNKLSEIGVKISPELQGALDEYDKICHVRHCCVHRFGHLGTRNAEELGMKSHRELINNVFTASQDDLDDIADALQQFVKTCNNHIYRQIIERTVIDQKDEIKTHFEWKWSWNYRTDKKYFEPYYKLFASTKADPPTHPMREAFFAFEALTKPIVERQARDAARRAEVPVSIAPVADAAAPAVADGAA